MHKTRIGKKIFSVLLAQTMVISLACSTPFASVAYAEVNSSAAESTTETKKSDSTSSDKKDSDQDDSDEVDKEEIVYVITDSDGETDKVIVSDKLKNNDGSSTIEDKSDLTDIENVKGDEEYTEGSDGSLTWAADGNSISYQGNSTKDLPVNVKLSFTLDGKKVSASELAGKSGKVTIRFDYENKETKKVSVNGKQYQVYVPFTVISGAILDSDKFSNVEVENGKAITEGNNTIVFGYAVPGLKDSLSIGDKILSEEDVDLPDYVEIKADVNDFELGMTMTAVTNDLLNNLDTDDGEDLEDDIQDSVDDLQDATDTLVDGTDSLSEGAGSAYEGTKKLVTGTNTLATGNKTLEQALKLYTNGVDTLYEKVPALTSGVNTLNTGASKLASGAASLKTGTNTYVTGVNSLANGLLGDGSEDNPGYIAGVEKLAAGAKQLSSLSKLGDVSSAITQLKSAVSSEGKLGAAAAQTDEGLGKIIEQVDALNSGATGDSLRSLAGALSTASDTLSAEGGVTDKVSKAKSDTDSAKSTVDGAVTEIEQQASNVDDAKKELNDAVKKRNQTIESDNEALSGAQETANKAINDSIDDTNKSIDAAKKQINSTADDAKKKINEKIKSTNDTISDTKKALEKAAKALKDAGQEDEAKKIEAQIEDLTEVKAVESIDCNTDDIKEISEDKKSPVKESDIVQVDELDEVDTKDIDSSSLSEASSTLADLGTDLGSISFIKDSGTLSYIATNISGAAKSMGSDPFGSLLTGLKQVKAGTSGVSAGISSTEKESNSLYYNLNTLETATSAFPKAAAGITALNKGFDTLTANDATIKTGATQLLKNGSSLTSGAKEVADGASKISSGTSELASGSKTLSKGVKKLASNNDELNSGAKKLTKGAKTLASGTGTLEDGMGQLYDGAKQLADGMKQYEEEGIDEIVELYNDDIVGLEDRFEAVKKAGKEYQTYTELAEGSKGSVKFIYKSDEIKSEDSEDDE